MPRKMLCEYYKLMLPCKAICKAASFNECFTEPKVMVVCMALVFMPFTMDQSI